MQKKHNLYAQCEIKYVTMLIVSMAIQEGML